MNELSDKTILCTGAAGSIGSVLVRKLVSMDVHSVRAFDNDEYGLHLLKHNLASEEQAGKLRVLIGDVKDRERLRLAIKGVDIVFHLAALKNLEQTEYNLQETIKTNVDGTMNLVETCLESGVKKFVFISSDKAVYATTVYGASKFIGEKLVLWANSISSDGNYSVARFGNVIEARGNVFDTWSRQRVDNKPLTVTDPDATRYFWHVEQAVDFIISCAEQMKGGETWVPKMEKIRIGDLAYKVTGLRGAEKMHEELMTEEEAAKAIEVENGWIVK